MKARRSKDALAAYHAKRDFSRTAEPRGETGRSAGSELRFIVQKHDATRLHFDFRLELDGVLKSWAVTRGPSANPDDKRLAVRTEDHPLSYATFEGTIPEGEYGGGTVMLWDEGTWEPVSGKSPADLERGHLHFRLDGQRLKGEWILVRLKGDAKSKRENWLLRKVEDAHAGASGDLVDLNLTSIASGRTMAEIAAGIAPRKSPGSAAGRPGSGSRTAVRRRALPAPAFVEPQLATLSDQPPDGRQWVHEIKFDGYRCLAAVSGGTVHLYSRSGLDWTDRFGPVAEALRALDLPACLIDGEVVALNRDGNPDFSTLQQALRGDAAGLHFFAFDLLHDAGEDVRGLGLLDRKARLAQLLAAAVPPVHLADHLPGSADELLQIMCRMGQEGVVSKLADAPYRSGRSQLWLKSKCVRRQEFVIVGSAPSSTRTRPFASLLLAQHQDGRLVYKGKVGSGFSDGDMDLLSRRLAAIARTRAPLEVPRADARGVSWVEPALVAEVAYAEFTGDGILRHATFLGLREDKEASEIMPEKQIDSKMVECHSGSTLPSISHPDRVIFPATGHTKGDLADYYRAMAPALLRHAARRPLSIVRCPQGLTGDCFFQKHGKAAFGEAVHTIPIRESDGQSEDYLFVDDAAGLLACVQMGTIEFHAWASHAPAVDQPDRMIFDLDPDEGLDFAHVRSAARHIHDRLSDIGLVSYAMLSGGKGIHVVVPLTAGHDWPTHKDFARRFALALELADPDRFIATASKAKRKGRIFIDWLRNQRGATSVCPWSVRARDTAAVAVPVNWDELADMARPDIFTLKDQTTLLARAGSIELADWGTATQALPAL